ncbi:DUF4240 domain-containing protein [Leptobacterium flavescens]|uniref:DUF4240 domain-containing protein n=1 Tax=Leptobacterium flavescens TaxID=472055 RepID=A0A6P0UU34_9FLAO|nr:DUF4240 domain-containing protein [Leptobacterium flavescens]NER15339.1 DUF4240 domain-containing protein [Leptobacterium flavescens]
MGTGIIIFTVLFVISMVYSKTRDQNIRKKKKEERLKFAKTKKERTNTNMMDEQEFWELIDFSLEKSNGFYQDQQKILIKSFKDFSPEQLIELDNRLMNYSEKLNSYEHLAAASILFGGYSTDLFIPLKQWVICQGRTKFYDILSNPDNLADLDYRKYDRYPLSISIGKTYESKTNEMLPVAKINFELRGEEVDEADFPEKFPKLWERA